MLQKVMWVVKLSVLLLGTVSTIALLVHFAVPFSRDFVISTLPAVWASARIYLVPPYLFVAVNFIIVVIWVLSEKKHHDQSDKKPEPTMEITPLKPTNLDHHHHNHDPPAAQYYYSSSSPVSPSHAAESEKSCITTDSHESPVVDSHPEDKAVSMDATWEVIVGGGAAPARKNLKKCETWEVPPTVEKVPPTVKNPVLGRPEMKKSETFNESRRRAPVMRKDVVVVGNDELNRKVEAFIKKVNDEIRLQRQESHQRYVNAISRGTNYYA